MNQAKASPELDGAKLESQDQMMVQTSEFVSA